MFELKLGPVKFYCILADASCSPIIENGDVSFEQCQTFDEDMCEGASGQHETHSCTSYETSYMDANGGSHIATPTNPTMCQSSNSLIDSHYYVPSLHGYKGKDDKLLASDLSLASHLPHSFGSTQFWQTQEALDVVKGENVEYGADASHVSSNMHSSCTGGIPFQDDQFIPTDSEYTSFYHGNAPPFPFEDKMGCIKGERDESIAPYQNPFYENYSEFNVGQQMNQLNGSQEMNQFSSGIASLGSHTLYNVYQDKCLSYVQVLIGTEKQFGYVKSEGEGKMIQGSNFDYQIPKSDPELVNRSLLEKSQVEDDDSDVCVIESISHPAPINGLADHRYSHKISQYSAYGDSQPYMSRTTRLKARNERDIYRVALQVRKHSLLLGFSHIFVQCL